MAMCSGGSVSSGVDGSSELSSDGLSIGFKKERSRIEKARTRATTEVKRTRSSARSLPGFGGVDFCGASARWGVSFSLIDV